MCPKALNQSPSEKQISAEKSNERIEEFRNDEEVGIVAETNEKNDAYVLKLKRGYLSILLSILQTIVLVLMMIRCKVAPLRINPMIGPYPDALSYWGGKNSYLMVHDYEWWRLVTPTFLHAGVFHLICNISVQLYSSAFFEREWGSLIWLTIYLTSAIGSTTLSILLLPNAISVGSSGALCGLLGGKSAEIICRVWESSKSREEYKLRKSQFCGVILSVIFIVATIFIPYVDYAAHLGGLFSGLFVGLLIFSISKAKTNAAWSFVWFIFGSFLGMVGLALAIQRIIFHVDAAKELQDVCAYYKRIYENYECNCVNPLSTGL